MSVVSLDPDAALAASLHWLDLGNAVSRSAHQVSVVGDQVGFLSSVSDVYRLMSAAAVDLWTAAAAMQLLVEQVLAGDSALGAIDPARLLSLAAAGAGYRISLPGGDLGGTGDAELRSPFSVTSADPLERGRSIVVRAINDVGNPNQIDVDEIEIVALGGNRYLLVLPGVTDLSHPDFGWNGDHRSVRDVDQAALPSWRSTGVDRNPYAQLVRDELTGRIPIGSDLVIIGHSAGADAGLDLAADPLFNGAAGFNVTHVVAAGYDSRHQLDAVPMSTSVLVLENSKDQVVNGERAAAAGVPVAQLLTGEVPDVDVPDLDLPDLDLPDLDLPDLDLPDVDWQRLDPRSFDVSDVQIPHPPAALDPAPPPNTTWEIFDGGNAGFGHHPDNYAAYVESASAPAVVAFLTSLGTPPGRSTAPTVSVDVSKPAKKS